MIGSGCAKESYKTMSTVSDTAWFVSSSAITTRSRYPSTPRSGATAVLVSTGIIAIVVAAVLVMIASAVTRRYGGNNQSTPARTREVALARMCRLPFGGFWRLAQRHRQRQPRHRRRLRDRHHTRHPDPGHRCPGCPLHTARVRSRDRDVAEDTALVGPPAATDA